MKNNMKKILLLTGVLCLASVGGVSAYLTDYDKVSNQFTVGKVDVELTEDNWKPDDHKKIEPGKVISKYPRIKNTGINDAYAYLEVSIPTANVIAAADNGSRLEKRVQELFSFQSKASWTKLNSQKVGNNQVYVLDDLHHLHILCIPIYHDRLDLYKQNHLKDLLDKAVLLFDYSFYNNHLNFFVKINQLLFLLQVPFQ